MQQYKKIMSVAWVAALLLAISCSSKDNDDAGAAVAIGPRGGVVAGPDGVSLDIPKGALDEEVSFSIHRRSTAPAAGGGVVPAGNVYEFLPHGVAFKKDVVVTVPFDESRVADAAAALALFWANQEEGPYAALAGTQVDGFKRQVSGFTRHLSYGVAGLPEESKTLPLDTEPSDTGDTTDTDDTDGTDDTDTGTDDTDDTDTGTDDPVAAACDLSGWSLEQKQPHWDEESPEPLSVCFTLPQGLVLQPGFSLVVTTFSGEQKPEDFFSNFEKRRGLHDATWTLQESQIEKGENSEENGNRDDFWFISDTGVHYIDLARLYIYDGPEALLISFSDWPMPNTGELQSLSLRNGSCLDITGAKILGGENTQGSGELIDGPIEMFELTDNGTNMTRQVFSGYGETIDEWTIENIPMIASWVATPGAGAVPSGGRALITEIGSLRPDGEYGIPEFIEITCPGGKVADFCSAMNDQDCNDGEPLQSCARSLPLPHLLSDDAMQCVMDMVDCDEHEECWNLALEEEETGVTP
ncbi:MAG: hypothetical protein GX146_03440 [Myxococcales bacterium]|jgi:hypothetical protein|nr:hypothetical protein [Myxococcales bacterium]